MKILVACEFSGVVRDAFAKRGHNAISIDILPTESSQFNHIQDDVIRHLNQWNWDMMIAFPPCTHLAVSGARYFKEKIADGRQQAAISFVRALMEADIPRIAIENPIGIISSQIRKPDQIIQPWQFGHETTKATCLWLKNLPKLESTRIVSKGERQVYASGKTSPLWHAKSGGGQGQKRSITFQGIGNAMAEQWGGLMS